jgi:hypothetical protein
MSAYQFPYQTPVQSLSQDLTDWQMELAGAIEAIFGRGTHQLDELISGLNASRVRPPGGGVWTKENYRAIMEELGR